MNRRKFAALLGGTVVASSFARAQQPVQTRHIGVLMAGGGRRAEAYLAGFVKDLDALGWHDGGNLHIEVRWARGKLYESSAAELVALGPAVLVAQATPSVAALRRQASTIPIVFLQVTDPVGQGFVKSLAHPSSNITGFAHDDLPLFGKYLEMLTQVTPPVTRVAALYNPATAPLVAEMMQTLEEAARSLAVTVRAAPFHDIADIAEMMAELAREKGGGVLGSDFSIGIRSEAIIELCAHYRLPAIFAGRFFPETGGLMSYGVAGDDLFRRAAGYVDRILKGASPGDLPVQYPTKFELVINLNTARALGITIAPALLTAADEVIE